MWHVDSHAATYLTPAANTNLPGARSLPGSRAGNLNTADVARKATDGCAFVSDVWQLADLLLLLCHSVVGFHAAKASATSRTEKMLSSQAFFETPQGGEVAAGYLFFFIKLRDVAPTKKVNNC